MRAARIQGSALLFRILRKCHRTVNRRAARIPAKKTLASPSPRSKIDVRLGCCPAGAVSALARRLRADPLNLAGHVPVKGVRDHRTKFKSVR
jgi:hypothetical protein